MTEGIRNSMVHPIQEFQDADGNKDEERQPTAEPSGVRKNQTHLFVSRGGIAKRKNDDKR